MNCPKCGVENPQDAVFCSACGERIDGKKHCMKCGKLIDEKNVYCNYCGTRQDGKTVCLKCGTAYKGSFCPSCGVKNAANTEVAATAAAVSHAAVGHSAVGISAKKAMSIVQASLIFGSIVLMFVFSFFIGMSVAIKDGDVWLREGSNAFSFLIEPWKDISKAIQALEANGEVFFEAKFAFYAPNIVIALALGANIIVCLVYGILATCAFCKNIGRREVSLYKYLLPPVITTLLSVLVLKVFYSMGDLNSFSSFRLGLNGATIAEIVLVSLLLVGAIVLEFIVNGKKYAANILKLICLPIAAILLVVSVAVVSKKFVSLEDYDTTSASFSLSFILNTITYMTLYGTYQDPLPDVDVRLGLYFVVDFAALVLFAVIAVLTLYFVLCALKKDKINNFLSLGFSIGSVIVSVLFLVFGLLIAKDLAFSTIIGDSEAAEAGTLASPLGLSPIAGLILAVVALAAIIVYFATSGKKKQEPMLQEYVNNEI